MAAHDGQRAVRAVGRTLLASLSQLGAQTLGRRYEHEQRHHKSNAKSIGIHIHIDMDI